MEDAPSSSSTGEFRAPAPRAKRRQPKNSKKPELQKAAKEFKKRAREKGTHTMHKDYAKIFRKILTTDPEEGKELDWSVEKTAVPPKARVPKVAPW